MGAWLLGTVGFVLYFLYDINSLKWNNRFWGGDVSFMCISRMEFIRRFLFFQYRTASQDFMRGRSNSVFDPVDLYSFLRIAV